MGDEDSAMCRLDRGAEDAVAVLEGRARCVEDVLHELGAGITSFAHARAGLQWVGSAEVQFSWAADELIGELRTAASALDEAFRQSRGAATNLAFGGVG